MSDILKQRRAQQAELVNLAKEFVDRARQRLGSVTAWVYGSVARGDFNLWSDVDVFLVTEELPDRPQDRCGFLLEFAPPGIEPKGYTKAEFLAALRKGDPQVVESLCHRVLLRDDFGLEGAIEQRYGSDP